MSHTVGSMVAWLERLAPRELAESWDNVGLLVGDAARSVRRVMTCLTLSEDVADEAIAEGAELVVTHHPLPFRGVTSITTGTPAGRVLWKLIGQQIAVASGHTAFDSAAEGINQQWADRLKLGHIAPLVPTSGDASLGSGRAGTVPAGTTLASLAERVASAIDFPRVRVVGDDVQAVSRVAIACGSGGSLLDAAIARHCDALVTGEATFHTLLEARARGVAIVLTGHYASERFAMEWLAQRIAADHAGITCWPSRHESDPVRSLP